MNMVINKESRKKYDRQMRISGFCKEGQEKLKNAKVVVAGGLGSAASIYLAVAGVGANHNYR